MPVQVTTQDCVVHYSHIHFTKTFREVTETDLSALQDCKRIRQSIGGEDHHVTQCQQIPDSLDKKYMVHKECFKKFTKSRAIAKWRKHNGEEYHVNSKIPRFNREKSLSLYGDNIIKLDYTNLCIICRSQKMKVRGKEQCLSKFVNLEERAFKNAVLAKNDTEMKTLIESIDLSSSGHVKHEKCFNDYTNIPCKKSPNDDQKSNRRDFTAVSQIIEQDIITSFKCVSMETLLAAYGKEKNQREYRLLQHQIATKYGGSLLFLNQGYQLSHLIINKECLDKRSVTKSSAPSYDSIVKQAARILRECVEDCIKKSVKLIWPPSLDNLKDRKPPSLLTTFFNFLLHGSSNSNDTKAKGDGGELGLVESFSNDILYAVSNGTYLTLKHCSIGLGLHCMTGNKESIEKVSRFGHCITGDQVDEIEASLGELIRYFNVEKKGREEKARKEEEVEDLEKVVVSKFL